MVDEEIIEVLPSIAIARLFYGYGRLDNLLKAGIDQATGDFYEIFLELIDAAADFTRYDYDEAWGVTRWYFSFSDMVEYYRLCRIYGSLHSLKLKDNPFLIDARQFVECVMDFNGQYGFGWYLNTKINHKWASGIVFQTDEYFNGEYELVEALLSIGDWYKYHLELLRNAIKKTKETAAASSLEVMAA